ncbi:MAG: ABC transporter ATP-binding protein [Desulfobacterota bacterium]|nr:ABC transporter ATP-binding protein [Thermodesulfobacteriota bacterium]
MYTIEAEHLTKFYGSARGVVDLSFTVERGEIVGFLGPNGSGKTTTMRMLTCFFPPTSGTARICGHDIVREPLAVRRAIGYLPESVPLYLDMPVRSYLHFFAEVKGVPSRQRRQRVEETMQRCGLEQYAHRLIRKLSKGYRQRVGIAQALLGDPEVLILDEPTIGLDPRQIIEIRNLIKELGSSRTVILSTHILPEVSMTCTRVMIIHEGRLIAIDTPDNLMRRIQQTPRILLRAHGPEHELIRTLAALPNVRSVQRTSTGAAALDYYQIDTEPDGQVMSEIARVVVEAGWQLQELRPLDITLEQIFIQLITDEQTGPRPC